MARSRRQWGAIRRLPSGRYQAKFQDPDSRRFTAAPRTFATKREADGWLASKRTELDAGTAVDDHAGKQPLSHWWPGYWRSLKGLKEVTRTGYETAWRLRIEPRFGSTPVRRIKPGNIDDWVGDLIEEGVSGSKIAAAIGVLKRVLDRAVLDRAIASNPCALRSATLPRRAPTDRPVLSPAQVEKLAAAMKDEVDRVLVRLLAYGGLRIGEAFALRWSDVDTESRMITICHSVSDVHGRLTVGPTKTYATRKITIPDILMAQLGGLPKDHPLVFPSSRGTYRRYGNFRRDVWNKATAGSGVVATPHDLRATCASLLIDAGASPKDVQAHLGHEDVQTTMRLYVRVRPQRNVDIAQRLNALIAEV